MNTGLAFVFPGQGSQSVGMLKGIADAHPVVLDTFAEASEVFGQDLWKLAQDGPQEVIALTEITQPLMLVAGVACWRAWCAATDLRPSLLAGHSLGEYTAYVAAGSLSLVDAVKVVKTRGELMRDACPDGAGKMAAILGLDETQMRAVCEQAAQGQVVQPVNFNAPGQIVIAGHSEAVDRAISLASQAGAKKAMALAVSVPCHSDLMKPASEKLAESLAAVNFAAPAIPVVNNVDGGIELEPTAIREKLIKQLYSAVLWVDSVTVMAEKNVQNIVECGPGKVLCGLNKRIAKSVTCYSLQDESAFSATIAALSA
ncbi:Malonyl CoA-[acyl carrier protein] transacylase [gamma proteobacterium HdN1]|nr:Malonyl CoA-[acyl carrier protein] transacylase [gamma proteobacterium HdN1]